MLQQIKYKSYFDSPLGIIELTASDIGITTLFFVQKKQVDISSNKILEECAQQLEEYFQNKRKGFSIPLDLHGTEFQKKVWNELLNISFGKTISYLQLAKRLGDGKLIRAVGGANGKNPVSILVPCHRVIGSDGSLVGYGGGLDKKKWLLEFEGVLVQKELFV